MATTPYPFVANAILTASQLNSTFNIPVSAKTASYVLTAADAGTRVTMNSASATTITVNTSLFAAGDNLEITNIGAGVCTITAGTATVSTSGTLALVANAGGTLYFTSAGVSVFIASGVTASAGALVRISGGPLSGNTTTFSSVFSSTYDAYKIVVSNAAFSAGAYAFLTLGATATGYLNWNPGATTAGVYSSNFGGGPTSSLAVAFASTTDAGFSVEITNPNLAKRTFVTGGFLLDGSVNVAAPVMGVLQNTTQYTAFTFTTSSGNLTGTCNIYGYALS